MQPTNTEIEHACRVARRVINRHMRPSNERSLEFLLAEALIEARLRGRKEGRKEERAAMLAFASLDD